MDENQNNINPMDQEKLPEEEKVVEDVFSGIEKNTNETPNEPMIKEEAPIITSAPEIKVQPEVPIEEAYNENSTPETPKIETVAGARNFLFILILSLILIVGGFIIWIILK